MRFSYLLGLILNLVSAGQVRAEGGCPDGYYPIGGGNGGWSGCAPIPSNGGGAPPDPGPLWAKRWGAIAIDGTLSRFGGAEGQTSARRAIKAAISACKQNGGAKNCKVSGGAYYNQCGALAWGDSVARIFSAGTTEQAQSDAMAACSKQTTNCKIYYAGCSYPERVR